MSDPSQSRFWKTTIAAGRAALFFACGLFVLFIVIGKLNEHLSGRRLPGIASALETALMGGATLFCFLAFPLLLKFSVWQPAERIMDELAAQATSGKQMFFAFVAMEYYFVILNRTFIVFCSSEGLYGWKAQGPVSNADRYYFEPYLPVLENPALLGSIETVERLASLPGGFFISRAQILSVEFDPTGKWGMGGIPHSGKIKVRLTSGRSREFILLGSADGEKIRNKILTGQ